MGHLFDNNFDASIAHEKTLSKASTVNWSFRQEFNVFWPKFFGFKFGSIVRCGFFLQLKRFDDVPEVSAGQLRRHQQPFESSSKLLSNHASPLTSPHCLV